MRICIKCEIEKEESQFHKESRKKDGLCSHCKDCESKRCKAKQLKDPEHYRKIKRANARKHLEKTRERTNKRYQENKDKILQKGRESYWKNREKIIARRKVLGKSEESRKKDAERQKKWQKEHRENVRKAALKYAKNNRQKVNQWHHQWKKNNILKARAQQQIKDRIRRGSVMRPSKCEECLKECKPDAHHNDYSKPLEVQWLCRVCHNHKHKKLLDME